MVEVAKGLWLGNQNDMENSNLAVENITAMLNVAYDLDCSKERLEDIVYAKVGLQDGPGNWQCLYHAAILMLHGLRSLDHTVLVAGHDVSRCAAVAIMYQHAIRRMGWYYWLKAFEKVAERQIDIHEAHLEAFNKINWRLLSSVMEG